MFLFLIFLAVAFHFHCLIVGIALLRKNKRIGTLGKGSISNGIVAGVYVGLADIHPASLSTDTGPN